MQTIFLHWHGPFSLNEIRLNECSTGLFPKQLSGNGLYAITGKLKGQQYSRLQYIGITGKDYLKRFNNKHIVHNVTREQKLWLGKITYGESNKTTLNLAESMLIFFNDETDLLNKMKKEAAPPQACTLISMFFKKTTKDAYITLPSVVRLLPEILIWDKDNKTLRHKSRLEFFRIE